MSTCPLCDRDAIREPSAKYPYVHFKCPICGVYGISESLLNDLPTHRYSEFRAKAKFMAIERKLRGYAFQEYYLHDMTPGELLKHDGIVAPGGLIGYGDLIREFPANHEVPGRALRNIGRACKLSECEFGGSIDIELEAVPEKNQYPGLMLFVKDSTSQVGLLDWLERRGYIKRDGSDAGHFSVSLTPEGWYKVNEMEQKSPDSKQIFVAMWFAPEMESIYREGIVPGIENAGKGYKAKKIDEKETINKICDEIIAEIRKSRAVVADFTGQRGGVYYEAGFAMGLGIPVIWTVREDFIDSLHFDTNHYSHIKYKTPEELRSKLTNRILALGI